MKIRVLNDYKKTCGYYAPAILIPNDSMQCELIRFKSQLAVFRAPAPPARWHTHKIRLH